MNALYEERGMRGPLDGRGVEHRGGGYVQLLT